MIKLTQEDTMCFMPPLMLLCGGVEDKLQLLLGKLCALLRRARLLEQLGEPLSLAPVDGVHELRNVCDGAVVRPLE